VTEFKERRRFPRVEVCIEVPGVGEARNLSADGMWILLENPVSIGTLLDLEFRLLPEAPPIKCQGEIMWLGYQKIAGGHTEAGLKFIDLAESARKVILNYVASQYQR